jgi:F420-non-reducing hydrogenase iron-sulfur subunit
MKPQIVVYCCANSTQAPEEAIEKVAPQGEATVKMLRLPCSGRTDVLYIVKAFEEGADMALVVGCPEDQCRFMEGSRRASMRVAYANRLLAEAGVGGDRVRMVTAGAAEDAGFAAALRETIERARVLGPSLAGTK